MTDQSKAFGYSKPKAVIFDWDNTLVDSWAIIHDALNITFAAYEKPLWSIKETRDRVRGSMRDSFPGIFGDEWTKAAETFYQRYEDIHETGTEPLEGVVNLFEALQGQDIYLAVVSNKTGRLLRKESTYLGWDKYFTHIIGAGDAERDKPAPDPVIMALADSGFQAGPDVWFVGDADVDLECAIGLGCVPILVRPIPPSENEFEKFPPTHYFNNCNALCKFVQTL